MVGLAQYIHTYNQLYLQQAHRAFDIDGFGTPLEHQILLRIVDQGLGECVLLMCVLYVYACINSNHVRNASIYVCALESVYCSCVCCMCVRASTLIM